MLFSSHVLAEVEQTVDDVLIIAQGRLLATELATLNGVREAVVLAD